jgi:hypothetical protein
LRRMKKLPHAAMWAGVFTNSGRDASGWPEAL